MISHVNKLIFIHIPRCGGTSIEHAFGEDLWKYNPKEKHISCNDAINLYGHNKWNSYFTFTIIRNPYDRIISMWKCGYYGNHKSLFQFLLFYKPALHEFHKPEYGSILNNNIDKVYRFENIDEVLNDLNKRLKISGAVLPHKEKSIRNHYSKYYTKKTIAIVGYLFRKDIENYNYRFVDEVGLEINIGIFLYYIYLTEFIAIKYLVAVYSLLKNAIKYIFKNN